MPSINKQSAKSDTDPVSDNLPTPEEIAVEVGRISTPPDAALPAPETAGVTIGTQTPNPCPACWSRPRKPAFERDGAMWYECEDCGTVAVEGAEILPDLQKRADALKPGKTLAIQRPFRAMRRLEDLATARDIQPGQTYLLTEAGAYLAGRAVGLLYSHTDNDHTIIFIKE